MKPDPNRPLWEVMEAAHREEAGCIFDHLGDTVLGKPDRFTRAAELRAIAKYLFEHRQMAAATLLLAEADKAEAGRGKRLYVVTVSYSAYVWAGSWEDAENFAEEIVRVEDYTEVVAHETNGNELGWDPDAFVYHDGAGDLALRDVLIPPCSEAP